MLGGLRVGQRGVGRDEPGTRVGHGGPEHQFVEAVADVVVVADRLPVASRRVAHAARHDLLVGDRRTCADPTHRADRAECFGCGSHGGGRSRPVGLLQRPEQFGDVAGRVDVTGDVGTGETEFVGGPHEVAERRRAGEAHSPDDVVAEDRSVPELERDRWRFVEELGHDGPDGRGNGFRGPVERRMDQSSHVPPSDDG